MENFLYNEFNNPLGFIFFHTLGISMKTPDMIKLTPEQADSLFAEVRGCNLPEECKNVVILGLQSLLWITSAYQEKKHQLFRFMRNIFGAKTEKVNKKNKPSNGASQKGKEAPVNADQALNGNAEDTKTMMGAPSGVTENVCERQKPDEPPTPKDQPKGHGHRSANDFKNAFIATIALESLKERDPCPECPKGILYRYPPGSVLSLIGEAPIQALCVKLDALRCGTCGAIFKAALPKLLATQSRAMPETKALVGIFKYKGGMPFYRFDMLQDTFGTRISKSELWEMVADVADSAMPIYSELCKEASKAEVVLVDDTHMIVLDLLQENKRNQRLKEEQAKSTDKSKKANKGKDRTGMFTTAILTEGLKHNIIAYFTGRCHAGENLDKLLDERPKGLPVPIEGCDALPCNKPKNHETQLAFCNSHNRRHFFDLLLLWPKEAMHVLDLYSGVFYNEKVALERKMSKDDKLKYHQEYSSSIMMDIKKYCDNLLESKKIEPNDVFGKSIAYQNKHWDGLTLFLKVAGAPLTTNSVERSLKPTIRNRKNSLFYKTEWGALVGDIHHTIIETCIQNDVNPMDYLVACQICSEEVRKNPHLWLPWNFGNNLSYIETKKERDTALDDLLRLAVKSKSHSDGPPGTRGSPNCCDATSSCPNHREQAM
jgi:transposase